MAKSKIWPDFKLRNYDPKYYKNTNQEILKLIGALLQLNQTGVYSAFFEYYPNIGLLEISLYSQTGMIIVQDPIARYRIDCRNDYLSDADTEEPIDADKLIERMILVAQ